MHGGSPDTFAAQGLCDGTANGGPTQLVVVTGGPGAGKTAVLEMASRALCSHVGILPEAAGVVFSGGFPRRNSLGGRRAAQRAIYHIQRELEALAVDEENLVVALCDRGTIDGVAYWPDEPATLWESVGTTLEAELARYSAVIHLQTPHKTRGYHNQNHLRIETAEEAQAIDERIAEAWSAHPRRTFVPSQDDFLTKATKALTAIAEVMPAYHKERA